MADLGKAYVQIVPSAQGISGKIEELLSPEADKAGKTAGTTVGQQIGSFAKKAVIGLGVGKAISDSISNGMEFETAMAKASTLFTGTSTELSELQGEILKLSSETGVAASQLAEAAYSAESASVPMGNLGSMLENSAKLATAGYTDIDTALSATAKTMNAYGMVSDDVAATNEAMEKVQRVLIQTQNKGITTVGELGASLANVTPTAAAAGVGFEQVGAALAVMTAQGTPTAQATTQLRSAIAELEKDGTKASSALAAAAENTEYAGMNFVEMMDSGADLGDVFGMLQDYADDTGVSMLDLWSSIEGGNAAMAIAKDVNNFDDSLGAMSTSADVVGEAYGTMADTVDNQMARIKTSFTNLGIEAFSGVASGLASVLNGVLKVFRNIQPALQGLGGAFKKLFTSVTTVIGKMLGLKEGFSASDVISKALTAVINTLSGAMDFLAQHADVLVPAIMGVVGAITAVKVAMAAANVAMALMNTNPIVLAIGAVVAAIAFCVTHWELIKTTVANVSSAIMGAVSTAWNTVTSVISGAVSAAAEFIAPIWEGILTTASSIWESIKTAAQTAWAMIGGFLSGPIESAKTAIETAIGTVSSWLGTMWGTIQTAAQTAWAMIGGFLSGPVESARTAIETAIGAVSAWLGTMWETIKTAAQTAWDAVSTFMSAPIETAKTAIGLAVSGLSTALGTAWELIKTAVQTAWDAVSTFMSAPIETAKTAIGLAVSGLSTALGTAWELIKTAVQTAWDAVSTFMSDPIETAKSAIGTAVSGLSTALGTAWELIKTAVQTAWDAVSTFMSAPIETAKTAIGTAVSGLTTALSTSWEGIKTTASTAWDAVKGFMANPIDAAKTAIGKAVSGLSTALSRGWNGIKTTASTVWEEVKSAIKTPIETARDAVESAIEKIKGFFDFQFVWPHIPMPHFSINPPGWKMGDLLKGSIPSLGVTWEAKAKKDPYMFTGATLFGAGEAGDEILYGRNALMKDIREAVGGRNTSNTFYITVDGTENPEDFAKRLVRQLKLDLRTA